MASGMFSCGTSQSGTSTLVSVNAKNDLYYLPGSWSGSSSDTPEITPDGRYVAFLSSATNLVPGVTTISEVYVRDLVGGTTTVVSTNAHAYLPYFPPPVLFLNHVISDNGQFVVFASFTNTSTATGLLFRQNIQGGAISVVASNALPRTNTQTLDMTPDGRFIAFLGKIDTGTNTATTGVFVWDAQSATTSLISTNLDGTVPTNSACELPVMDSAGQFVAFRSTATDLTTNALDGEFHLFVHNLATGTTMLVDATTNATGSNGTLWTHSISANGHFVAFDSDSPDLAANDGNQGSDVFLRDLSAGTTELISAHDAAFPSELTGPACAWPRLSMSADGRYAAFAASANGVLHTSSNRYMGVFVRDLLNGTTVLASKDTNGVANGNRASFEPAISGNGRYVAFTSFANNLVPQDGNQASDVFVCDLTSGVISLVSTNAYGAGSGNGASRFLSISSDGRYVLFSSFATNLCPTFVGYAIDALYLRDRVLAITYALAAYGASSASMTPDGRYIGFIQSGWHLYVWDSQAASCIYTNTSATSGSVTISPSGRLLAWYGGGNLNIWDRIANTNQSAGAVYPGRPSGFKFSADERSLVYSTRVVKAGVDTNGVEDVFLYDLPTGTQTLVSLSTNSVSAANGASTFPDISADGRFVALCEPRERPRRVRQQSCQGYIPI